MQQLGECRGVLPLFGPSSVGGGGWCCAAVEGGQIADGCRRGAN